MAPVFSVAVIDDVGLELPWITVRLLGVGADRVKPNGAATVRDNVVV
jgi:hypothetical protein